MTRRAVAKSDDPAKALVRAMAMDIGKQVVHHIETMYPKAISACSSTFKLSVRNCVHNEIIAAIEASPDADEIVARLHRHSKHRREIRAAYSKIRAIDA